MAIDIVAPAGVFDAAAEAKVMAGVYQAVTPSPTRRSTKAQNTPLEALWSGRLLPALELRLSNIISLSNYDIVEMSAQMRKKPPREWSTTEASEHFEWFMRIKEERVRQITQASESTELDNLETKLHKITATIRRSLDQLASVAGDVQSVNGLGLVVGFDAALVVGDALTQNVVGARWTTMKTPIRTLISKNFPVVRRDSMWAFEPWLEGRLLLSLINREVGKEQTNVLDTVYNVWRDRLEQIDKAQKSP